MGAEGERAMMRINRASAGLAKTTSKIVGLMSGLYVGVAAFGALTREAKSYDYELRGLAAVSKSSATKMRSLVDELYSANSNLKEFTKSTVAKAARQLAQAGYDMTSASMLSQRLHRGYYR